MNAVNAGIEAREGAAGVRYEVLGMVAMSNLHQIESEV